MAPPVLVGVHDKGDEVPADPLPWEGGQPLLGPVERVVAAPAITVQPGDGEELGGRGKVPAPDGYLLVQVAGPLGKRRHDGGEGRPARIMGWILAGSERPLFGPLRFGQPPVRRQTLRAQQVSVGAGGA